MQYKTIINIDAQLHDDFVAKASISNLLQSSSWAKIKDNWESFRFSITAGDDIVASSLILVKVIKKWKIFYIPRGPILDYSNEEIINFYFDELKKYAKKCNCIFIKIDPAVIYNKHLLNQQDNIYDSGIKAINNLKNYGFKHHGFTKYIKDTFQPRFVMQVDKNNYSFNSLSRSMRKTIRSSSKKGVEINFYNINYLDKFAHIMDLTQERKQVNLRNKDYFAKLLNTYEHSYLILATIDLNTRIKEIELDIEKINHDISMCESANKLKNFKTQKDSLEKELVKFLELQKKYQDKVYIAGELAVGFGDEVEFLYAGMNDDFQFLNPQSLLHTKAFEHFFELGYQVCSMGGVEGTLDDGLSKFKSKFNPYVVEYIGEFDLVLNKPFYLAYKTLMNLR